MDITAFIRELLFGHDCVVIPGFGGFIGNYSPARIDKSTGTFYPPVKQISFNRNLNHNDGLLVGRISLSAKINYGDARSLVEDFVAGVRKRLEKGEKVVFDKIGSFINNNEGNLQFEPDQNVNYHLDSYGLEPFHCLPLEGYDVRKRIIRHLDKDPLRQTSIRKIVLRAAVVVPLLALIVAVSVKTNLFSSRAETLNLNPLVTAEFENNRKAVDEGNVIDSSVLKEVSGIPKKEDSNTLVTAPVVPEVEKPVSAASNGYFVITGSFKSRENADTQVNMLKEDGFSPEIVTTDNGFYRVCAMMCNDVSTAVSKKDSISKKFPGAWISRKK